MTTSDEQLEQLVKIRERYLLAAHAVMTGTGLLLQYDPQIASTKQMRTGIDMSKSDFAGLSGLLMSKGIFTELEYLAAITAAAEQEKAMLEKYISENYLNGVPINLV